MSLRFSEDCNYRRPVGKGREYAPETWRAIDYNGPGSGDGRQLQKLWIVPVHLDIFESEFDDFQEDLVGKATIGSEHVDLGAVDLHSRKGGTDDLD